MSGELLFGINTVESALSHDPKNILELYIEADSHNARLKCTSSPRVRSFRQPECGQSSAKCPRFPRGSILKRPRLLRLPRHSAFQRTLFRVRVTALLRAGMRFAASSIRCRHCLKLYPQLRRLAHLWWRSSHLLVELEKQVWLPHWAARFPAAASVFCW